MKREELNPEEIFKQFSTVMYEWNLMCIDLKKSQEDYTVIREKKVTRLNEIYQEYVTDRKRIYGRQASLDFSNPPEYNLETNEILSCTEDGKKAYIEVQEKVGFKLRLRYTLHKKKDGWRVDKRESYDDVFKNKWETIGL
jgi:hypothetical protein